MNDPQNILIVDDEPGNLEVMARSLDGTGARVVRADNGHEALAFARDQDLALAILDAQMPGMDGFELARKLRELRRSQVVPIIFVSAVYSDNRHVLEGYDAGAVDYIVKPYHPRILIDKVNIFLQLDRQRRDLEKLPEELDRLVKERTKELGTSRRDALELARQADGARRKAERAEGELRRTQSQILQQERLRTLGQMVGGIAHDLNNALTPILGYSEFLLMVPKAFEDQERARRHLETIHLSATDAAEIISRMREFYRPREEDEVFLPADLGQVVEQALRFTQPQWKDQAQRAGIPIRIETDLDSAPLVSGLETGLREALANLILNAVDAMPEGGTISFRARPDGEYVSLGIRDTGAGMTDEVREHCFEPFFTTKGDRGTGLGLGMVFGIVDRHGGSIKIDSRLGEGTTFTLRLPAHRSQDSAKETGTYPAFGRPLRVLVVEDQATIRLCVAELLALDGHTVETAADGKEGLSKYRAGGYDLIMTDRAMPELNGDQMVAEIGGLDPSQPIIMMSGFAKLMADSEEIPAGVDAVIGKPVRLKKLRKAIAEVMAKK